VLASKGLPKKIIRNLQPWPLHQCVPFTQETLAGFFARSYEIELEVDYVKAREIMQNRLEADITRRINGDPQQTTSMKVRHTTVTLKSLLLPIWLLAYKYNDQTYQVCVNTETGKVQSDRPYNSWKIAPLTSDDCCRRKRYGIAQSSTRWENAEIQFSGISLSVLIAPSVLQVPLAVS